MDSHQPPHILVVVYPLQSHINPAIQFADHLLNSGAHVSLATTVSGAKRLNKPGGATHPGLYFATISDGYDDGFKSFSSDTPAEDAYMLSLKRRGSETLSDLIFVGPATGAPPYTFVIYTILLSWVADVAHRYSLPFALLWIQNAALLSIYYHYFYGGYGDVIDKCDENDPQWCLELPSLPPLQSKDLPTFLASWNPYRFARVLLEEQFEELEKNENPMVLVNTFDTLEHDIIESLNSRFNVLAVGPLLPRSFLEITKEENYSGFRFDLFKKSEEDVIAWMDTQPDNSVVYVSFGSIMVLSKAQKEEIAVALLECKRPFMWVMRNELDDSKNEMLSQWEELKGKGIIVSWCSQVEVLSHRAMGCFVTHCGWNSILESLTAGVPVVEVPQWADQLTNAKMLESVWGTGLRVRVRGMGIDEKVVDREELQRCVEEVMESEEIKGNARRWRQQAVQAAKKGGSSEVNIGAFVEEVWSISKARFDASQRNCDVLSI